MIVESCLEAVVLHMVVLSRICFEDEAYTKDGWEIQEKQS